VAVLLLAGSLYLYRARYTSQGVQATLSVPGGHLWASERIDPFGTKLIEDSGISEPQQVWQVSFPAGASGSPVISASGTIYVASLDAHLMAFDPDGTLVWEAGLPAVPYGPLAIGPDGDIYVADTRGGLSALSPDGHLLWTYTTEAFGKAEHGAIVAPNGTIYYLLEDARGDTLTALHPGGELLWSTKTGTRRADSALRLSADASQIYIRSAVINTEDGSISDLTIPTQGGAGIAGHEQLFVGADGRPYLLAGHIVMQWEHTQQGFTVLQSAEWDYHGVGFSQYTQFPVDAVVTPAGNIGLIYSGFYGATRIVWLESLGKFLGNTFSPFYQDTHFVAVDGKNTTILCGIAPAQDSEATMCAAYKLDVEDSLWQYILGVEIDGVVGAAMAPGRLYVITGDGNLTAIGNSASSQAPATAP